MNITTDKYGDRFVEATVTIKLKAFIYKDETPPTTSEEAMKIVKRQLYRYAESNDGSELLANIPETDIKL